MKILFLSNLLPYPLDNGGKINSYTKLKALHDGGHAVDLLCFDQRKTVPSGDIEQMLRICRSVKTFYLRITTEYYKFYLFFKALCSLMSEYSYGVYKFQSKDMVKYLRKLAETEKYDCIYFNHLQLYVYGKYTSVLWPDAKTVLDEHNCETMIMQRSSENCRNIAKKIFLELETYKLRRFEKKALAEMFHTIVLSREDYDALEKVAGGTFKHTIIQTGVPDHGVKKDHRKKGSEINILFVGSLAWKPNDQGLVWFLEKVLPLLDKAGYPYHLYIVGKNASEGVKKYAEQNAKITITGYVEDVNEYYELCQYMIVPLFIGSGLRVKIIEAFSYGMPVVSTSTGAEGIHYTEGEDILIGDSPIEFAEQMEKMLDLDLRVKLSNNCRKIYVQNHSIGAMGKKLNHLMENLE